ncbi:MAG: hypothetical protein RLO21_16330 [Nitratireductor sp.]
MTTLARRVRKPTLAFHYVDNVPVGRIFLSLDNPRHEPVESEGEAIQRLCTKEDVVPLAKDIVRHGLSPLERFAMTPIGKTRSGVPTYWVAEGNRRICALKLLADPDLAPPKYRKTFEKLSESWSPVKSVAAVVFNDLDTLRVWLDRVHSGTQGGIGRKNWDADQKQRFSGGSKNRLAQAVLDYAETEKMITKEERKGKLTTAQRFLNPEVFQETLGLDRSNPNELSRTRPKAEFDMMLRRFMRDLVASEEVTSRKNKPEIIQYARGLTALPNVTNTRIEPEPLSSTTGPHKKRIRRKPTKPQRARHVQYDEEIYRELKGLGNEKLESLYYSICSMELEHHTPLASIGAWAFLETLTSCAGRSDDTAFDAFLSKQRLTNLGIAGNEIRAIRTAIDRTVAYGNLTKHHKISAAFNGDQLNNDMITLKFLIIKLIEEATNPV